MAGVACLALLPHIAMDATEQLRSASILAVSERLVLRRFGVHHRAALLGCATPLVFVLRTALARTLVGPVLCAGVALSFLVGLVPQPLAVGLVVLMLAMP